MHIVTVATKNDGYLDYLIESCKRNGGNLEILGWRQEWKGFMMKIKLLNEYLNNLDDDDIVCYVDGYDVIILQHVDKIESLFRNSGSKILLSKDANLDIIPLFDIFFKYYYSEYKNYNINAGTFIGYVKYLKIIFNKICNEYDCNDKDLDDQIILTKICNEYNNKNDINIDINRNIFLVIGDLDSNKNKIKIQNNELIFNNNIKPCILHGVGNYNLSVIIKKLNYNIKCTKHRNILTYLLTTTYFKKILTVVIIIIIIIIMIVLFNNKNLIDKLNCIITKR
jgi:hypothetical protein